MVSGLYECVKCRQPLPAREFGVILSAGRKRRKECEVCRHQRLAREHGQEAAKLLEARRKRRAREQEDALAARAAAGRE
jgi:DNA-directed RNA polymerase subunit RPC12/RpoP